MVGCCEGAEDLPALALVCTPIACRAALVRWCAGRAGRLACVRTLRDGVVRLRHPLLVIDFAAEEATTSASPMGSLSFVGKLTRQRWTVRRGTADYGRAADRSGFDRGRQLANRPPQPIWPSWNSTSRRASGWLR